MGIGLEKTWGTLNRRDFLTASTLVAAGTALGPARLLAAEAPRQAFKVGEPMLHQPAPHTMAVGWGVSGLAYGAVEVSESADFARPRRFVCSKGCGVPVADDVALTVLLTDLKPDTAYRYRTVTTPILSYPNAYRIKVGAPVVGAVRTFRTPGESGVSRIAVINDTHMRWTPFERVTDKVRELKPAFCVWNGDATNSSETKTEAARAFYGPEVARRDYAAEIPYAFVYGNHDLRGKFAPHLSELVMDRAPSEREARDFPLGHSFAIRQGQLAVIGLDTGEDKTDDHPQMYGHATYDAYRQAQADWLARTLRRPDIASAPFVVVCCHIPLFDPRPNAYQGTPRDFRASDGHYFGANWSPASARAWGPILSRHGVQLVVAAHEHRYRYDAPTATRPWAQVVGGGPYPEENVRDFPTVIECAVETGQLVVRVHDVWNRRLAGSFSFAPRPSSSSAFSGV